MSINAIHNRLNLLGIKMAQKVQMGKGIESDLDVCKMEEQLRENVVKMTKNNSDLIVLGNAVRSIGSILHEPERAEWKEISLDVGKGYYRTLDKNEFCHLIDANYHPNSEFPVHTHPGFESIVVYYGICEITMVETGEKVILGDGHRRTYYWNATAPHKGFFPVATGCYGLTMPPGY